MHAEKINLSEMARSIIEGLCRVAPNGKVEVVAPQKVEGSGRNLFYLGRNNPVNLSVAASYSPFRGKTGSTPFLLHPVPSSCHLNFSRRFGMLEYFCDTCHKRKKHSQGWILGLAAESQGAQTERREITILPSWSETQAVHPLAVHFCCERCREKYTNWLFSYQIAS